MALPVLQKHGDKAVPPKIAAMRARKRRKLDGDKDVPNKKAKSHLANNVKHKVKADALQWKAISMPDRMDDYEGFFGLEEIEDVDVVRDNETGHVSFLSNSIAANSTHPNEDDDDDDTNDGNGHVEDEWSGFDDEEMADAPPKIRSKPNAANAHGGEEVQTYSGSFSSLFEEEGDDAGNADVSAWANLRLSPDALAALSKLGFIKPSAIQEKAIPEILAGHDVIGKASTGSGKTLAFGIPILEHFLETQHGTGVRKEKTPIALILSPTRELAHQLDKHISALCSNMSIEGPTIATLTGGLSVQKQQRLLKNADIVIGTPGRLWEVISDGQGILAALKRIKFLVVDEADRLLSQGHFKEAEEILNALDRKEEEDEEVTAAQPIERQTLVFSATFDRNLQRKLATRSGNNTNNLLSNKESMEYLLTRLNFREEKPKFVDVDPISHLASGLKESLVECPAGTDKDLYLYALILLLSHSKAGLRTLVFVNSISAAKRLAPFLQNLNLPALALHSGMPQKARLRSIERFTNLQQPNSSSILVATDVAARGLDIPNVQLILHYHLPRTADAYVHRSGRTARAGQSGSTVLLCAPEEVAGVRRLIAKVHASNKHDGEGANSGSYIRTLDLNRKVISRLKPRATLAKKLADVQVAKEKQSKEDDFMRAAAEELGVDYDSDTFADEGSKGRRGRGAGREKKAREAKALSKAELASIRAELKALLKEKVNVGVSERYLTSGNVDVDALLREQEIGGIGGQEGREFLGSVHGLGLEDL